MKIKTKNELNNFLSRNIKECPRVRRYNKSIKQMEYFWIVDAEFGEPSVYEAPNEPTFNLIQIVKYGYHPLRISVDFYTLISSFDFVQ